MDRVRLRRRWAIEGGPGSSPPGLVACGGIGWYIPKPHLERGGVGSVLRRHDGVVFCLLGVSIEITRLNVSKRGFGEGASECFVKGHRELVHPQVSNRYTQT